ncbi:YbjN domain-containing protein [Sphingomonas flavalba]|uniref:YbjN domain-containing protein n=1 Tax=Sphingomonas flavalba TaxID=2559804 RepID=UPI00109D8A3C|nr:YbjN domain-containing protein [Sphingomonas flavalba]
MRAALIAIAVMVAVPGGAAAQAQTRADRERPIDVSRAEVVANAVRDAGYKAELKHNEKGDPYIVSAANGAPFIIEFYGCRPDSGCSSLQFYSWYRKEPGFTLDMVNEWNAGKRFLKAYIDKEGDLGATMDVTTIGRMTQANFADALDWWAVMSADLATFIDKRDGAPAPVTAR